MPRSAGLDRQFVERSAGCAAQARATATLFFGWRRRVPSACESFKSSPRVACCLKTKRAPGGDGVNIAARLEGVAKPGAICLSEDAYRQVRDKVTEEFVDLGEGLRKAGVPEQRMPLAGSSRSSLPTEWANSMTC